MDDSMSNKLPKHHIIIIMMAVLLWPVEFFIMKIVVKDILRRYANDRMIQVECNF